MCQLICSSVQFLIRELFILKYHGDCIRGSFDLFFEQLVDALVEGIFDPSVVPF